MSRYFLICFFLFFTCQLIAQPDFRKGYIVTNQRDTVQGFLNYRESAKNFEFCEFATSPEAKVTRYGPEEIRAYKFDEDKLMVSTDIAISGEEKRWCFLEVLVAGKMILYKYRSHYLVKDTEDKIYELIRETENTALNGRPMVREINRYIGILKYLMRDCPGLQKEIEDADLSERDFTELVEKYNQCTGIETVSYKQEKPWFHAVPGIVAGIVSTSYTYETIVNEIPDDFNKDVSFSVGVDCEISLPRLNEYFSFYTGLFYLHNQLRAYSEGLNSSNMLYRNDLGARFNQLQLPLTLRYTFPERQVTPYINAGVGVVFLVKPSDYWIQEIEKNKVISTEEGSALYFKKCSIVYIGSFGLKVKLGNTPTTFEVRYENIKALQDTYGVTRSKIQNIQFLLGVTF